MSTKQRQSQIFQSISSCTTENALKSLKSIESSHGLPVPSSRFPLAHNHSWSILASVIHAVPDVPQLGAAGSHSDNVHTSLHLGPGTQGDAANETGNASSACSSSHQHVVIAAPQKMPPLIEGSTAGQGKERRELIKTFIF